MLPTCMSTHPASHSGVKRMLLAPSPHGSSRVTACSNVAVLQGQRGARSTVASRIKKAQYTACRRALYQRHISADRILTLYTIPNFRITTWGSMGSPTTLKGSRSSGAGGALDGICASTVTAVPEKRGGNFHTGETCTEIDGSQIIACGT